MLILNECKKLKGESFIPVRLLRLKNYVVLMLLHSEDENTWCIYAQDKRGSWISPTYLSKSISWLDWEALVDDLTKPEIDALMKKLEDPSLTDADSRFYTLQELVQLNLGDYAFYEREKNEVLSKRVSDVDIVPELNPNSTPEAVLAWAAKFQAELAAEEAT